MKGLQEGTVNLSALRGQIKRACSPQDPIYITQAQGPTQTDTSLERLLDSGLPLCKVALRTAGKTRERVWVTGGDRGEI